MEKSVTKNTDNIKIFLNFDFYGAGNIGDDLMLDGFLEGIKNSGFDFTCALPGEYEHQQLRFPQVRFVSESGKDKIACESNVWLGVGDTPVQMKSGDWMLNKLLYYSKLKNGKSIKYFFIGVGAEKEALKEKEKFESALTEVDFIWTRDKFTTETIINDFGISSEKVETSSDLANISLMKIFGADGKKGISFKYDAGICYYDENPDTESFNAIRNFTEILRADKRKCLFFGNEVKTKGRYEFKIYNSMFGRVERYFDSRLSYYAPDYYKSKNILSLVSHYAKCDVIISSRYHALLAAAWAGCRVVSLERSSKVSALADELGIIEVKKPYKAEDLLTAFESAGRVERTHLRKLYDKATQSVNDLKKKVIQGTDC